MKSPRAFIALGANLPFEGQAPAVTLARAVVALRGSNLIVLGLSSLWETEAWPPSDQPAYCNAVAELDPAGLAPQPLYEALRTIEAAFGRTRRTRWDARTLDLDILALDGFEGSFGEIQLPHPCMQDRAFVLAPLAELAPEWRHPLLGLTVAELFAALGPAEGYRRIEAGWAAEAGQAP